MTEPAIRLTTDDDRDAVLELLREAFAHDGRDGQEEVDIVVATWKLGDAVAPIDLVAMEDDVLVGHVLGASGKLGDRDVIAVAPLAVAPSHHGRGVGSALMHELLARAEAAGLPMVLLLGSPVYYGRFGFEASGPLGITYAPVGADSPHFQARRLASYDSSYRGDFVYCWER